MNTSVVPYSNVRELVRTWQDTTATVRRCFAELVEAERLMNERLVANDSRGVRIDASGGSYRDSFDAPERCIDRMRIDVWRTIVERLELHRFLSVSRWKELSQLIEKGELPEITEQSVFQLAESHMSQLDTILTESVREVFDWLRPRDRSCAARYKRNEREVVGERLVLPYLVEQRITGGGFHVTYGHEQHLVALENVLHSLAGRGFINRSWRGELGEAIEASPTGVGETFLFRFKCHKNRNLHLQFKDTELLAKFNAVAGGANLSEGHHGNDG